MRAAFCLIALSLLIAACGSKGPLTLATDKPPAKPAAQKPAPEKSEAR